MTGRHTSVDPFEIDPIVLPTSCNYLPAMSSLSPLKIRITNAAGQCVRTRTHGGDYTIQIVSTRHGWSDTAPTTYCIAAMPQVNGKSCPLSPSRTARQQAVTDWNDGFEIPNPSDDSSPDRSAIVTAMIAGGSAEYIGV